MGYYTWGVQDPLLDLGLRGSYAEKGALKEVLKGVLEGGLIEWTEPWEHIRAAKGFIINTFHVFKNSNFCGGKIQKLTWY